MQVVQAYGQLLPPSACLPSQIFAITSEVEGRLGKGPVVVQSLCVRGPQDVGGIHSPQAEGERCDNTSCYPGAGLQGLVWEAAGSEKGPCVHLPFFGGRVRRR